MFEIRLVSTPDDGHTWVLPVDRAGIALGRGEVPAAGLLEEATEICRGATDPGRAAVTRGWAFTAAGRIRSTGVMWG